MEQLRNHVLGWLTNFAAGFADPDGQAPQADVKAYEAPADVAREVHDAADLMEGPCGAGPPTRPLKLGESAMPGELALGVILWEYQVHGWDLAPAGSPLAPGAEPAVAALDDGPTAASPPAGGRPRPGRRWPG